jgi:hypothetical protein
VVLGVDEEIWGMEVPVAEATHEAAAPLGKVGESPEVSLAAPLKLQA